jgi:hypothetical protein
MPVRGTFFVIEGRQLDETASEWELDIDMENHDFDAALSRISSTMYASREDVESAMSRHIKHCDNTTA